MFEFTETYAAVTAHINRLVVFVDEVIAINIVSHSFSPVFVYSLFTRTGCSLLGEPLSLAYSCKGVAVGNPPYTSEILEIFPTPKAPFPRGFILLFHHQSSRKILQSPARWPG